MSISHTSECAVYDASAMGATDVFRIVKDKIGEASVKLQFSQEEAWTRALRHVLLALKIILKWTTNGGN